tara:strand:- start:5910 stop:6731 length:822 start_codon:yes stop_codon:yes gene_type:complete
MGDDVKVTFPQWLLATTALLSLLVQGCTSSDQESSLERVDISIFAAASLRDVLLELGSQFQKEHPNLNLVFNFAGSNTLALQILAAPKADLFISADEKWMDRVTEKGKILPKSRVSLISNRLLVISNSQSNWQIANATDLCDLEFQYLSIADPEAVPAGRYAKSWLKEIGCTENSLWEVTREKVAETMDVRAALNLVKSDRSIIGIVYRSDAHVSKGIRVLHEVRPTNGPYISYSMAILASSREKEATRTLYQFLLEQNTIRVFRRYGFISKS